MVESIIKASFHCDVEDIWEIVTSLDDYEWRSDIANIEVFDEGRKFIEYTKDGFSTKFTVLAKEQYKCWKFSVENDNIKGTWLGMFSCENNITTIEFSECVSAKKIIMKPFVKGFLKKQQARYIADLQKAIESK